MQTEIDMGVGTMSRELDELTVQDLRDHGSLKWTRFGGDTIGAFIAEMDFGAAPPITQALHHAVSEAMFGYLPPKLSAEVAQACARWQRQRYGWRIAPEQVQPVSDVLTGLELVMRHFGDAPGRQGSPLIVPTPTYMPFLTMPPLHGRELIQVPMVPDGDRLVLDLDGIDRAFAAGGHLLVLCNPANPVGRVLSADELRAVTEVVDRHGGRVFADEIHGPLVYREHRHIPYASTSETAALHTVTATSASKAWNLPGLKCAQLVFSNPADLTTWRSVGNLASAIAGSLGAVATVAAYRSGEPWLRDVLGYLDRNRQVLGDMLPSPVRYTPPEGTYLAWLDCRQLGIAKPGEFLRERAGVAVVDGAECGEGGQGFVRLTFATPMPILARALTRIRHAIDRSA